MASGERPLHFMGHDRDGEAPGNNSKRSQSDSVPTQIGASYEDDINKGDKKLMVMKKIYKPMFRRMVRDEVTTAQRRHPHLQPSPSGDRQTTFQLRFKEHDRDGEAPGNNSKRTQSDSVPTQISDSYEDDINKGHKKWMENISEFRRMVRDGVTTALSQHPHLQPSPSGQSQTTFQLRFKESPGESYTGERVETKNGDPLEVALYQCDEERIVTEGPLSSARVRLYLLRGEFGSDGRNDWSSEDFGRSTLNHTRKGRELLTGDLSLTLINGVATVNYIVVHDNSSWTRTRQFRLGARVVETTPETENIKEGISQPFRVKHCSGRGYRKHGTPSLDDDIWRLEDISKDGKRHKWLLSIGIYRVRDFLHWLRTNPLQLKQGLQKVGIGENVWNKLIRQAAKAHAKQDAKQPDLFSAEDEIRKISLRHLSRKRDFIRLLLSYPIRTVYDGELKAWIREASNRSHSLDDLDRLLCQKPLNCFQCLLPTYILENAEIGWGPKYADSDGIPEDILSLSVNLAVDQLIQNLLFEDDHVPNIHHVLLSTRDTTEKRLVKKKIESALKDQKIMLHLHETFTQVLLIDASNSQGLPAEVHVQHQIAQQLHLPMIEGHGYFLIKSIEKEMAKKKYLVLLVDGEAFKPLDTRKVGIPEELAGVVVCITSKQANSELTMAMDLNISTKDHLLPWKVFRENIGLAILQSEYTKTMAACIVKECGGHLLAGAIVAKSLRNAKHEDWEHALYKLRSLHSSYDSDMFQGQSSVLLKAFINFIWHDLSKTQKYCLTSCLFIPKFGKLDNELINDWISSRLVVASEAEHTLRELVDRFALLQLEDTKSRYIQIPQDTYAVLQLLNTQNPLFMKKSELGLVEAPNSELWHSAIYIDLADNKLPELPLSPDCHELKVLKLHNNDELMKIPPLFFFKMPILCILDLSYTSVRELPNSFFELEQLREFYMKSCVCFMKLSSEVGKLKNLEKIDLDKTQITHLPKEIQELTNLQSLTLCLFEYRSRKSKEYRSSTIISSGVISKLQGLKHLSIDVSPDDERWEENLQVILPEVSILECLQTISLYIPAPELLNLIPPRIFELDFRFTVGKHMSQIISSALPTAEEKFKQSERSLKFVKGVDVPRKVSFAVRHSKALFLDRHMTIKDLSKFGMKNIRQLQVCILAECKEMQTIVDGRCSSKRDILPRLLVLSVSYMKNLRSICEGEVHSSHSFGMLKTLALHNCPVLTTVFTLDFLVNLSLLKVLVVKDCPKVSALISCGPYTLKAGTFLPKLRTMTLVHLPELVSISNGLHMGPGLENIGIYNCPKLERLSKMELSSQNLKVIKGDIKWWEALTWSEAEWGIDGRPSIFGSIFSPIDKQADIMSQLTLNDDIDDNIDGRPSIFDSIFSPIDKQADIMGQLALDDDIDDNLGGIVGEPLQSSSVTNSSLNNQVDLRAQSGVDDDINYHPDPLKSTQRILLI